MTRVTAIGRRRRSGEPNRRAHDRTMTLSTPVTNVRVPWHQDARRITELTANDNIIVVMRRS
jgi:hypothetical protein